MPLIQTQAPVIEPVALSDVWSQLEIIESSRDTMLLLLIGAARRYAETYTRRSFITQKWKLVADAFPGNPCGYHVAADFSLDGVIQLDRGIVQTVDSVGYTAMDGTAQVMPTTDYVTELSGCPGRVALGFGKVWPIAIPQIGAVTVNYTAGYGPAATDVPEGIRHWILMRIATLFENREEVAVLARGKIEALPFVDTLLDPYVVALA